MRYCSAMLIYSEYCYDSCEQNYTNWRKYKLWAIFSEWICWMETVKLLYTWAGVCVMEKPLVWSCYQKHETPIHHAVTSYSCTCISQIPTYLKSIILLLSRFNTDHVAIIVFGFTDILNLSLHFGGGWPIYFSASTVYVYRVRGSLSLNFALIFITGYFYRRYVTNPTLCALLWPEECGVEYCHV